MLLRCLTTVRGPLLALGLVVLVGCGAAAAAPQPEGAGPLPPLNVAVAANTRPLFEELRPVLEQAAGVPLAPVYGASGTLYAQISHGAPFELFLSADSEYPQQLERANLTVPGSLRVYALGRLALWAPPGSPVDPAEGLAAATAKTGRLAIPNPELAPYGAAALAALQRAGGYPLGRDQLVLGENAAQAVQFAQSGGAGAALIPLSLAVSPELRAGRYAEVPASQHPPLEQAGVVLRSARRPAVARRVLDYLLSPAGAAAVRAAGYDLPLGERR